MAQSEPNVCFCSAFSATRRNKRIAAAVDYEQSLFLLRDSPANKKKNERAQKLPASWKRDTGVMRCWSRARFVSMRLAIFSLA